MRQGIAILFALGAISAAASTPEPRAQECAALDRIPVAALSNPGAALDLLERVALGRHEAVTDESAESVGIRDSQLRGKAFGDPTVRACSMHKIGEIGTPAAEEFLAAFRPADVGVDPGQEIWPAAQIALRQMRLARIADRQMQSDFLEGVLAELHDTVSDGAVALWAVDELCNRGATGALPAIRSSIRSFWHDQYGDEQVAFCEARIRVWHRDSDRIKGLSSVLDVNAARPDLRLTRWAIHQLASLHSAEADAVLSWFADEVENLQKGPGDDLGLRQCQHEIRLILMGRAR